MNHLEEIRAKINIEDLVGGYVQLKQAGRNLKGICPFHNDTRPSLMVSPDKGIAYCFACNQGGDIFKFIQLVEKVEFPEAVRILAEKANVALPAFKPEARDERKRLLEANQSAVRFYADQLETNEALKRYFLDRGLQPSTIRQFELGYSPDSYHLLKDHLKEKGFSDAELLKGGLVSQRSIADGNTFDRFRNRYMFPIYDHQGNAVGFGGRIIGEGEPKYLNSPDTPVYNKSLILYGLHLAKEAIKKQDAVIFVEGYMDVITAHQAGTRNAVATSGTALTPTQLKLIKRYTNNILFAFDQDSAGMEATMRAIEIAQEAKMNIRIIRIPHGKDPDDCIRENPEDWNKAIEAAVSVMDFYFDYAFRKFDKGSMEGKKQIMTLLLPIISHFQTSLEQNEYLTQLAHHLQSDPKILWDDMKKMRRSNTSPRHQNEEVTESAPSKRSFSGEAFLIGFILKYPQKYTLVQENLIDTIGFDPVTEKIYKVMKDVYNHQSIIDESQIKEHLDESDAEQLTIFSLLIEEHYQDFSEDAADKEILDLIRSINRKNLRNIQKSYENKIRMAEDPGERTLLLNQYNQILKLQSKLN
jgi:DNA primase